MSDELDLVARMLAFEAGHALPGATRRAVDVRNDARVVATLSLAGHDHSVHAIAFGHPLGEPEVYVTPDPRRWSDQLPLLGWWSDRMTRWFEACEAEDSFPQVWVADRPTTEHLDLLADVHRFAGDARVRSLGRALAHLSERAPVEGQQSVIVASEALAKHWITGQSPDEDGHLGRLLAWIDRPGDVTLADALTDAEATTIGTKTAPEFDRTELAPRLERLIRLRDAGHAWDSVARELEALLGPFVRERWMRTVRAVRLLERSYDPMSAVAELTAREREVFAYWCRARDEDRPLPLRDSAKASAFRLVTREDAIEQSESARVHEDAMARARAMTEGRVIEATVREVSHTKDGRKNVYTLTLESSQRVLRVRPRDEFAWLGDARLRIVVERVERRGTITRLRVRVSAGMMAVGVPAQGATMSWGPPAPDWSFLARQRKTMKARLAVPPWTHAPGTAPATHPAARPCPVDPLAALEALR